jgi:PTH1 family peptidyl-tRNA hydrolase
LAMPQAFMNVSGEAVGALRKKHRIDIDNMLVVCDDMDLEFGRLRIRPNGSSGGHRGLSSIIGALGKNTFCRLRIGIGRPSQAADAAEFVLSPFTNKERAELDGVIDAAADCCLSWVSKGVAETMNIYNKRSQVNE